ncbi:uncharacterized protein BYT42DRAFT_612632 [Radiomyces spectabilis]|uniref:uncharacterized protein n=1 Tax=Radiomyces spectabilis TaxID=64574 RepID=UPI00221EFF87|nr:uncharacterized protein BYT42DRAFT_612632 [Radiomyces spectabilis]KAI8384974.1 hypothetical protein BYT42DRAFT_612632 [Radiomyces spectabilis]
MHKPSRIRSSSSAAASPRSASGAAPRRTSVAFTPNDRLDTIFQAIRQQIDRWGEHAKWKIDLVLMEPGTSRPNSPQIPHGGHLDVMAPSSTVGDTNFRTTLHSQPARPHPSATSQQYNSNPSPLLTRRFSPVLPRQLPDNSLSINANVQYPWDYIPLSHTEKWFATDDENIQQQHKDANEREHYLERIIRSQSEQLGQSQTDTVDASSAIETMQSIFLMNESEQKQRYNIELKMLEKEIEILSRKVHRMNSALETIEKMELSSKDTNLDKETLTEECRLLLRKLHLAELRLAARDAELNYLHDKLRSYTMPPYESAPVFRRSPKPNYPPSIHSSYLLQQQYSPKLRTAIRPQAPSGGSLSGLESLGILADQMLSDPDFETNNRRKRPSEPDTANLEEIPRNASHEEQTNTGAPATFAVSHPTESSSRDLYGSTARENGLDSKRSKRSIDSANALLTMPSVPFASSHEKHDVKQEDGSFNQSSAKYQHPSQYNHWTVEQDTQLRNAVAKYGFQWDLISRQVLHHTSEQCRQRWTHSFDPNVQTPSLAVRNVDARHSPSIAALLDSNEDMIMRRDMSSQPTTNHAHSSSYSPHSYFPEAASHSSDSKYSSFQGFTPHRYPSHSSSQYDPQPSPSLPSIPTKSRRPQ